MPPLQSASMPSCSTVPLVKPSMPTQAEDAVGVVPPGDTVQFRYGTKKVASTCRNETLAWCDT